MPKVISKDGTLIAFEKTGKGETLIVLDGALCSRAFGTTFKLVPLLSEHFTVVTYDRRGRNESGNNLPYSVEREVEDIEALINESIGPVYIVGFSSGAGLAIKAASKGLNIKSMVLYEPPYVMNQGGHNPPHDAAVKFKRFIESNQRGRAVRYFMKDVLGMPAIIPLMMSISPMWPKAKAVAHTLEYDAAIMGDYIVPETLVAPIILRILVACGERSDVALRNAAQKLADCMPNAACYVLKDQNHDVSMNVLAPILIKFFHS